MKTSLKLLAGAVSLGLGLSVGLPTVAQVNSPAQTAPNSSNQAPYNDGAATGRDTGVTPIRSQTSGPLEQTAPMQTNPTPGVLNQTPTDRTLMPMQSNISVPMGAADQTLDSIMRQSSSFELFNALLRVAESEGVLSNLLAGDGNYTVFAPTDQALAALPAGTFKALVQPENRDLLVSVLQNHIVRGKVMSSQVGTGEMRSLSGSTLNMGSAATGGVTVGNSAVIAPDIQASNGVIHAINGIILTPAAQAKLVGLAAQPAAPGNVQ